jgi:hypothetical protein
MLAREMFVRLLGVLGGVSVFGSGCAFTGRW